MSYYVWVIEFTSPIHDIYAWAIHRKQFIDMVDDIEAIKLICTFE